MGNCNAVELPDQGDNIIRTNDVDFVSNPKGFGYELFKHIKQHTESIAQIEASTGKTDTFINLRQRCIRLAVELKKRGVTTNDIVVPCTTNHLDTSVLFLAPLLIGAKVASLDPYMAFEDMKGLLDLVRAKFIFVSKDAEENVSNIVKELKIKSEIVVFGHTDRNISFEEFSKPLTEEEELSFTPWKVDDPSNTAFIVFSSGSTGIPKGICCSHATACQIIKFVEEGNVGGIIIAYSTLIWGSAIFSVIVNIVCGTPRLICCTFEPAKTWNYIEKYKVERIILTPHDCISMIKYGKPPDINCSSVRIVTTAGGGLSLKSIKGLKDLFPGAFVCCPYGQTEVFGQVFNIRPDKMDFFFEKPNCVGWPAKGIWYKIVDQENGKICGPNEIGELRLKTKFQMSGYYKMDSAHVWDSDGYLKTGDIAYYDDDQGFFIVERLKEVLRYKMHPIAPSYLENILQEHPAVKIAVVIGISTDEGDLPMALIVKQQANEITGRELEEFLATKVDKRKILRAGVKFIQESDIERTPSGKIRRYLMRRKIIKEMQETINQ